MFNQNVLYLYHRRYLVYTIVDLFTNPYALSIQSHSPREAFSRHLLCVGVPSR